TAPSVNVYNLRGTPGEPPQPTSGPLTNYLTGEPLAVTIECVATGSPDFFGAISYPEVGTPAYNLFNGIVDIGNNNSAIGVRNSAGTTTTFTFHNLDPGKRYIFRGTAVRGNNYLNRWTKAVIQGADVFVDAFTAGVYTKDNFPSGTLGVGEQAWNSGENRADGALVGWDEIRPGLDGSFSIHCEQYIDDPLPNGQAPALGNYGYAICGFMLAEVGEPTPIVIVTEPAPTTTVEENRPFSLSVGVTGSLPTFQWYKNDVPIDGETKATYSVDHASLDDAGTYHVVIKGFLNPEGVTSMDAEVIVNEDLAPPALLRTVGSASLTQITLEFNEELDPGTAEDSFNFSAEDSGMAALGIISATLTNN
ncbi:MAG TPA: hypothetical protein VLD18_05830, partial [Verrucomicrobiae bacterium]|nr:hypothetical protein [Verrucomicrobiae bacterium]